MASGRVHRNIYFYKVEAAKFDKKLDRETEIEDVGKLSEDIMSKIPEGTEGILNMPDGGAFLKVDSIDEEYIKYRYVLFKANALPFIEADGELEELSNKLENNENLAEITHGVWFRKHDIIGVEYNSSGARATLLSRYVRSKIDPEEYYSIKLHPLIDPEPYARLRKGEELSLLKFKMFGSVTGDKDIIDDSSLIFGLGKQVADMVGTIDTIEVCIKKRKTKRNKQRGFKSSFSDPEFAKKFVRENKDRLEQLVISQEGTSKGIDLLNDKFVKQVTACRTENRTLDTKEMYSGIISGFENDVLSKFEK